ncbi:HAMP domain-containing sensor histidine kinase [Cohnella sp. AR92]|uniref:HAMP domain-containing sensor histidine kinase n=1 Tax=Cohnella sp. AR92 TaxID=648716 RepID=UPI0013156AC9|nr:HAMP domain-containing sensor histidine kinase [Cohnella sp. AR92]
MGRLKRKWKDLSIRHTIAAYTVAFMLLATLLSGIAMNRLEHWQAHIYSNYYSAEESYFTDEQGRRILIGLQEQKEGVEFSRKDGLLLKGINVAQLLVIPVFYGGFILLAAMLIYRHKLKKPIELIEKSAEKIAHRELDFSLDYESRDEMGRLCASLDSMRDSLEGHYREMWRTMEERKQLNAAFSHDLRTPLTVLRGYTDFLNKYVPQGRVKEEKLLEVIGSIAGHAARIQSYVDSMSAIQKLEDIAIHPSTQSLEKIGEALRSVSNALEQAHNRSIAVFVHAGNAPRSVQADLDVLLRVADNLIGNAIRYARAKIAVELGWEQGLLTLKVQDDGDGFSEEALRMAASPFYQGEREQGGHFGMGLHIARLLCEKHGGKLQLANADTGGAIVVASFLAPRSREVDR